MIFSKLFCTTFLFGLALSSQITLADPLSSGGVLFGSIAPSGDTDTHTFSADVDDSIILHIGDVDAGSLAPKIRLFDPDGIQVDSASGSAASFLQHRATKQGIYSVQVTDGTTGGTQTGNYVLYFIQAPSVISTPIGDEGGELTSGSSHVGSITLGDIDAYQFTAAIDDSFVLHIGDTDATSLAPRIRVFDPNGLQVGSSSGSGAASVQHRATIAGTFTVVVSDGTQSVSQTGTYDLNFVKTPSSISTPSGDEGGELTSGSSHLGSITIGDADAYQFTAAIDDSFVLHIGDTGATSLAPRIRVFDPNGLQVVASSGSAAASVQHRAIVSGTFTVVVTDGTQSLAQTGTYDLNFAKTPGSHIISIGDDGAIIKDGDSFDAEITIGDVDVWVFGVGTGGQVTIEAEDVNGVNLSPWIRVFDPNGLQVSSSLSSSTATITFNASISGDYLAVVSDGTASAASVGLYQLRYSSTNDILVATQVVSGSSIEENIPLPITMLYIFGLVFTYIKYSCSRSKCTHLL